MNESWTLRHMTLLNWGTYDGLVGPIDMTPTYEDGRDVVCIAGENGTGKTTLTDAYMMLLRPEQTNFNAASNGNTKSYERRSVRSYMRGEMGIDPSTGQAHTLRETDIVISAVLARFENDNGGALEAAVLMCENALDDARERRVYATSPDKIDLTALSGVRPDEFNQKGLASRLGTTVELTESPSKYQAVLSETFGIGMNYKDFRKLTRLLAMLQGEDGENKADVTKLFKAYVLPTSDVPARVEKAKVQLDSNLDSLDELVSKKRTINILEKLEDAHSSFVSSRFAFNRASRLLGTHREVTEENSRDAVPDKTDVPSPFDAYATTWRSAELSTFAEGERLRLAKATAERDDANEQASQLVKERTRLIKQINANEDERVRTAKVELDKAVMQRDRAHSDLEQAKGTLMLRQKAHERAHDVTTERERTLSRKTARVARIHDRVTDILSKGSQYGLSSWPKTADAWSNMLATVSTIDTDREQELRDAADNLIVRIQQSATELAEHQTRLDMLLKHKSRIPAHYPDLVRARDRIAETLGVEPEMLPFFAEIVDMAEGEERWRIAANAVYGGLAKQMLIDKDLVPRFRQASKQMSRQLGLRLTYHECDLDADEDYTDHAFKDDTIAAKLVFDESSDYMSSARALAAKYDYACVEDATHFDEHPYCVAPDGHTHRPNAGTIGTNKRDRDLIGFSSALAIEDERGQIEDIQNDIGHMRSEKTATDQKLAQIAQRRAFAQTLHALDFDELDLTAADARVDEAKSRLDAAHEDEEAAAHDIQIAQSGVQDATSALEEADALVSKRELELTCASDGSDPAAKELQARLAKVDAAHEEALTRAVDAKNIIETISKGLRRIEDELDKLAALPTPPLSEDDEHTLKTYFNDTDSQLSIETILQSLSQRAGNARSALESRRDTAALEAGKSIAVFERFETELGNLAFANLEGYARRDVTDEMQRNGTDPDKVMADPWLRADELMRSYYAPLLDSYRVDWQHVDVPMAKRICVINCADAISALVANTKEAEKELRMRMADINAILDNVRLGDDAHTLRVAHELRRDAEATKTVRKLFGVILYSQTGRNKEEDLDKMLAELRDVKTMLDERPGDVERALDANQYVRISFFEHREGIDIRHDNLGKLSGGEVQQISACVIGAALIYAMGAEPGQKPSFATVIIDEAFVKSDETHALTTVRTLTQMGFVPVISMPLDCVMKFTPLLSKLFVVTKSNHRSNVTPAELDKVIEAQGDVLDEHSDAKEADRG